MLVFFIDNIHFLITCNLLLYIILLFYYFYLLWQTIFLWRLSNLDPLFFIIYKVINLFIQLNYIFKLHFINKDFTKLQIQI